MDEGQPKQNTVANGNGPIIHYYGQFPSFGPAGKKEANAQFGVNPFGRAPRAFNSWGKERGKEGQLESGKALGQNWSG